jgi:hypothetical protein
LTATNTMYKRIFLFPRLEQKKINHSVIFAIIINFQQFLIK